MSLASKDSTQKQQHRIQDSRLSESTKKIASPKAIPQKLSNISPKANQDNLKSITSRSKPQSTTKTPTSKPQPSLKISEAKTSNDAGQKPLEVRPKDIKTVFPKDPVINSSKENTPKFPETPIRKHQTKRQQFDGHKFLLQVKNNTASIKFCPLLSKTQKKILKSFTQEFHQLAKGIDYAMSGLLNYSNFCKTLNILKFIANPFTKSEVETNLVLKAWRLLGGFDEQKVPSEDLHLFLLAVLGLTYKLPPPSPQTKHRKSIWNLSYKEIQTMHAEFSMFYMMRTDCPVVKEEDLSQDFSEDEGDVVIDTSNFLHDLSERCDGGPGLSLLYDSNSKVVRKISLRELSSTPSALIRLNSNASIDDEGNVSLGTSESEDNLHLSLMISPLQKTDQSKVIVRSNTVKGCLNNTVSYINEGKKFNFGDD